MLFKDLARELVSRLPTTTSSQLGVLRELVIAIAERQTELESSRCRHAAARSAAAGQEHARSDEPLPPPPTRHTGGNRSALFASEFVAAWLGFAIHDAAGVNRTTAEVAVRLRDGAARRIVACFRRYQLTPFAWHKVSVTAHDGTRERRFDSLVRLRLFVPQIEPPLQPAMWTYAARWLMYGESRGSLVPLCDPEEDLACGGSDFYLESFPLPDPPEPVVLVFTRTWDAQDQVEERRMHEAAARGRPLGSLYYCDHNGDMCGFQQIVCPRVTQDQLGEHMGMYDGPGNFGDWEVRMNADRIYRDFVSRVNAALGTDFESLERMWCLATEAPRRPPLWKNPPVDHRNSADQRLVSYEDYLEYSDRI